MKTDTMNRRDLLRGLGGIAIGLPFLEEMLTGTAAAASLGSGSVPARAFNVFFGLGVPTPLQGDGFEGVLEPLKEIEDKLLIMRGVDHVRCDKSGINGHFDGSSAAFTATPPDGEARAGGASIDQMIRKARYPDGLPEGMVPTLVGGTFFRRSRISRYVHSFKEDGSVAAIMQETPRQLFERVFGVIPGGDADARTQRLKRSVLDSVVDQYRHLQGPNSPLGEASKARVSDHLERIREYEQRAYSVRKLDNAPEMPPTSQLPHGGMADPGGQGLDMDLDGLVAEWRLMSGLYALAIQMDRTRFGSLTFLAAGERLRIKGDYFYGGEKRWTFDDAAQLKAGGDKGCSHEWWHKFNPKKENEALRWHAHMKLREVVHFLKLLDGKDSTEANGKSILENSLFTISTESGDGRHNDVKRELSGIFHACTGAGGRMRTGQILDVGAEGIDVYNTMLESCGVSERLGPGDREHQRVESILA